ncbi:Ig-like domain-containing protein [Salinirubellus salinus]|uniref:Ig-like domain-containing protein n=1 Tax=Salinirubellus salinus TaxID=1364945 RepID=A0A9E7R5V2_9EURY|nr:Ig-like domain-containing protein [Salinirubellus salinus]UWM56466.1 Ig-like domain-containing protein [Salinirubellus salinus]
MSGPLTLDGTDADHPPRPSRTDRGVSELLGAILLFGLLVAVLVLLQANAVPSQNERVEFDHNQRVQADVLELASATAEVAATGRDRSAVLELAPEYPNRFLLLNPGRAQGRVSTADAGFTVENAVASGETADYWDGSALAFDSRSLAYVPNYNVYRNAPTTRLAHGTVTDRFPDGTVTAIGGGSFVDGRRISLVALDGERSESRGGALSVEVVPLATETETVTVTDDDGPVFVRLQTDRTVAQWEGILEPELAPDGFVTEVRDGPGETVEVVFDRGETYQLQLGKVGVGGGVTDPDPAYLTARGDTAPTVDPGAERELTVQVRDGFNAPEPGVEVTFAASEGRLDGTTVVTDADGEATVTYTAGSADGTVTATVDGGTGADGDPRSVVYDVTVQSATEDPGQGSEPGDLNPGGDDALQLRDAVLQGCRSVDPNQRNVEQYDADGDCVVRTTFESTGQDRTVSEVRIAVFDADQSFTVGRGSNAVARVRPTQYAFEAGAFRTIGQAGETLTPARSVPEGETRTYTFAFRRGGDRYNVVEGDLFVLKLRFSDGTTSAYIVAPQD